MRKKSISLFIILTLILQICVITIPANASSNAYISSPAVEAEVGDVVYFTISLTENPGLTYLKLKFTYNTDALTLFGVQNGNIFTDMTSGSSYIWSSAGTNKEIGTLATLIFLVSESASIGNYPIAISCIDANNNQSDVNLSISNGYINVLSKACLHEMNIVSTTKPTCQMNGNQVLKCTKCGYSETIEYKSIDCVADNEADCENDSICIYCGDVIEEALSHNYSSTVIAPTTSSEGYTLYSCMRCNKSYKSDIVPPVLEHQHEFYSSKTIEATCTDNGYVVYRCTDKNCGEYYVSEIIPAKGHVFIATTIAPTCQDNGYTRYTCTACNKSYEDNITATVNHKYENNRCVYCNKPYSTTETPPSFIQNDDIAIEYSVKYFTSEARAKLSLVFFNNGSKQINDVKYMIRYNSPNGEQVDSGSIEQISGGYHYSFYVMLDRSYNKADLYYISLEYTLNETTYISYSIALVAPIINNNLLSFCIYENWISLDGNKHIAYCENCSEKVEVPHWYTNSSPDACVICNYQSKTTETLAGDINGDGAVNDLDVELLIKYLTDWNVTVNRDSLDINGDGKINNKDVTRLMQYIAGRDVEIH